MTKQFESCLPFILLLIIVVEVVCISLTQTLPSFSVYIQVMVFVLLLIVVYYIHQYMSIASHMPNTLTKYVDTDSMITYIR